MKIRTLLVDDEQVARSRLSRLLRAVSWIEIVAECADGTAALEAVRTHAPDLLLLDIQMPGMNGFDVLEALTPRARPAIIFVTAYDEFAIRAFEACALDYLLKPVAPERLMKSLDRAASHLQAARSGGAQPAQTRFIVRNQGRVDVVSANQIEWIEAAGNYAVLHTHSQNHIIRETMSSLESRLPSEFLRVSRSAILNMRHVNRIDTNPEEGNTATTTSGHKVAFTRKISEVRERL